MFVQSVRKAMPVLGQNSVLSCQMNRSFCGKSIVLTDRLSQTQQILSKSLSEGENGWEKLWKKNLTPWDLGMTTPALSHELKKYGRDLKRVLVPGCGSGYDLITLIYHRSSHGGSSEIVGLDLSTTSIQRAKSIIREHGLSDSNSVEIVEGDFFNFSEAEDGFDFIFDYTFFCALPHNLRQPWGKRMGKLVKRGGRLLTLVYPIDERNGNNESAVGPPFPVTVEEYEKVLFPEGFVKESECTSEETVPQRKGRELVVWWVRKDKNTQNGY
mmetsp:Transcript_9801/g.14710  ORF Transcript_9801/g.14710 Transcript_9801/m.14710 type:complete len:270 (-) Transcript_9801:100-909(-)